VHLCVQLNERSKGSKRLGRVVADSLSSARAVAELAETLSPVVDKRKLSPATTRDLRTKLVNVRLTDDELEAWTNATQRAGYARVSTWARHVVASLVGYTTAPVVSTVPTGSGAVRKNLAGVVKNVAQLCDVAGNYDAGLSDEFAQIHARIADLLRHQHAPGRRV
jgi:hypothetical protein